MNINFEFNNLEPDADVIVKMMRALHNKKPFGLQNKHSRIIVFLPDRLAVFYPGATVQICNGPEAFKTVISMSLYRYTTFVDMDQKDIAFYKQKLLNT